MFLHKRGTDMTVIAVYVDDIIITGSNDSDISFIKSHFDKVFSIKDLGIFALFSGNRDQLST